MQLDKIAFTSIRTADLKQLLTEVCLPIAEFTIIQRDEQCLITTFNWFNCGDTLSKAWSEQNE